ncbi:methanol oxidation system protein MoxJ [Granulibacter bethesdensis]|uniref:methanol oxidation system protein MoxJ n=1 Tax=Granulibacter bethesdensis TaxID=364410 RepID=UPI0003F1F458|nr:methanol oxidation system protein MoxJ [Granulibacter bethesdensis]AHJ64737.1 MoxJ protein precursor [Granulibacter bethesdensis CGDNIH4]APH58653.1 MoxJ protein precursor [Granulibacter bethesdensis]
MRYRHMNNRRRYVAASALGALLAMSATVQPARSDTTGSASSGQDTQKTLRICASTKQAPFSEPGATGIENKIMTAVAEAMGRKPVFVWTDRPAIYAVRDQLYKNTCDVVAGLDEGDDRVLTTKPYYRSSYVFITREDGKAQPKDWKDPAFEHISKIAVAFGSPGELMLRQIGKYEDNLSYQQSLVGFKSPRNQYVQVPSDKIISEVASGNADLGVAFDPEVARYVKASPVKLRVTVIPDNATRSDGQKVPMHYSEVMGVRRDDAALQAELDGALEKAKPQIANILKDENIQTLAPNS